MIRNISNWTKNMQSFPQFENTYDDNGTNTLTYKGGAGYERIYYPVSVTSGNEVKFSLKFCSPSGYSCDYGDTQEYIAITRNQPSNTDPLASQTILARTPVSGVASSTPVEYEVSFVPDFNGMAYLVIDFGYMVDGVQTQLVYKDIQVTQQYTWHIEADVGLYNDNFYQVTDESMRQPYPMSFFRISNGNLTASLIPDVQTCEGKPLVEWYVDEGNGVTSGVLLEPSQGGAFANAINLSEVVIPKTCKKIGKYSFRNTKLTSVTIARDCEYYPTSFPDGCVVNFYPD